MPNLRGKQWNTTTPAFAEDAQFWEDHLIGDEGAEKTVGTLTIKNEDGEILGEFNGSENKEVTVSVSSAPAKTFITRAEYNAEKEYFDNLECPVVIREINGALSLLLNTNE